MHETLIRLQGVGWGKGTPAEKLRPGDKVMWNYGCISEVVSVAPAGKQFLKFSMKSQSGKVCARRMKKTRLVALCEK